MSGLTSSLAAVALIAFLITIHEFGHFIVAKALGVRVRVFSVGLGGRLFGVRWGDTDYRISWFPFGGYVLMAGSDGFMEGGAGEGEDDDPTAPGSFLARPAWVRLLVILAGPVMNLVLPVFVFTALKVAGDPQPVSTVGTVYAGSPADRAGVRPDDRIVSVEGIATTTWPDVSEAFSASADGTIDLVVLRDGGERPVAVPVAGVEVGATRSPYDFGLANAAPGPALLVDDPASPAGRAGARTGDTVVSVGGAPVRTWNDVRRLADGAAGEALTLVVRRRGATEEPPSDEGTLTLRRDPSWQPVLTEADDATYRAWGLASATVGVGEFGEASSAAREAGVQVGDRLLALDGEPVRVWRDVVLAVADASSGSGSTQTAREIRLSVRRDGVVLPIVVTPRVVRDTDELGRYQWRPLLGIASGGTNVGAPLVPRPYPLPEAVGRATDDTLLIGNFMVEQLGKMLTGEAPPEENLGGPVAIFRETRAAAERGIYDWARQLGLFSLSLGIINLLPVPVLDGGRLLMYAAEWVRGRPLPARVMERAQQAGVIFLVLLMLFVFANDLRRWAEAA